MYATKVLHKLLRQAVPSIHLARLNVFASAIDSIANGACLQVTSIGRGMRCKAYQKHKIKKADRLLSNKHLYRERHAIYTAISQRLLQQIERPTILIDGSPLCPDQSVHLLRAAIPVGGRSLTLYEEIHIREKLGNRSVQHRFLDQPATMLPDNCRPIVVADSGFDPLLSLYRKHFKLALDWSNT